MIQFFKDSFRELKHVVWPTKDETQNFFVIVLVILIVFGVYLLIANLAFSEILITLRNMF